MTRSFFSVLALVASCLLTACVARGPMNDAKIARSLKTGLPPGDAWIVTRLHCPQCNISGRVNFWQGEDPDASENGLVRAATGAKRAGLPLNDSGKPVVTMVRAGRITMDSVNVGDRTGRGQPATAIIQRGTITYIGDVELKFSPSGDRYLLQVTDNPATIAELRQSQPALFSAHPLEVAILSSRTGSADINIRHLTHVKENHARIERGGQTYLLDAYIIPFQQPYHVLVRHSDKKPLSKPDAEALAVEYIRPRGCTQRPSRLPDLDRSNPDRSQWLIGIAC